MAAWAVSKQPERNMSTRTNRDEFILGVADAMKLSTAEAEAQWGGYSRQLDDDAIREIEAGGYDRGLQIGKEIAAL